MRIRDREILVVTCGLSASRIREKNRVSWGQEIHSAKRDSREFRRSLADRKSADFHYEKERLHFVAKNWVTAPP